MSRVWENFDDQIEYVVHKGNFAEFNRFSRSEWKP